MRGIKDFIVSIPKKYSDTFKTESGIEFYADRRFSIKKVANTIVEVVEVPFNYSGNIKKGSLLFIDSTVLMQQDYAIGGEQENINLLDKKNNLYKVEQCLIILYQVNKDCKWMAFGDYFLAEKIQIKKEFLTSSLIIMLEDSKPSFENNKCKVFIPNQYLIENKIEKNNIIFTSKNNGVDVIFMDKEYLWLRNRDAIASEPFFV
jgi:hypothetical protein